MMRREESVWCLDLKENNPEKAWKTKLTRFNASQYWLIMRRQGIFRGAPMLSLPQYRFYFTPDTESIIVSVFLGFHNSILCNLTGYIEAVVPDEILSNFDRVVVGHFSNI